MNILMMTNTYKPIVGGLEKSIEILAKELQERGHKVMIVAPEFEDMPEKEENVIRVPAVKNVTERNFSVQLPISTVLSDMLKQFRPDIIHSHHPFFLGDTALRISAREDVPIVYTFHTLYNKHTSYFAGGSESFTRFMMSMATGYANLCDHVFAPSTSIAELLKEYEVKVPVDVVPTGIYLEDFADGDRERGRKAHNIPEDAFLVGFVSRIAPEKNVRFLAEAVCLFMQKNPKAHFLMVGEGSLKRDVQKLFWKKKMDDRLHTPGVLRDKKLLDAYRAMDVFAFASYTETQGIVLAEAMTAGVPVVAADATGSRDVVRDEENGRLVREEDAESFSWALNWLAGLSPEEYGVMRENAQKTAGEFSVDRCVDKALAAYECVVSEGHTQRKKEYDLWEKTARMSKAQWGLFMNLMKAFSIAVGPAEK